MRANIAGNIVVSVSLFIVEYRDMKNTINSKQDYAFFVEADKFALGIDESLYARFKRFIFVDEKEIIWQFQKTMRKAEYLKNCKRDFLSRVYYFLVTYRRFRMMSLRLGFSIPLNTFGPGLSIAHCGTIVINGKANIGANCRIHVDVVIGASGGDPKAPQIGDNCYIGPGVKIFGDISVADNVVIGANSVVNKHWTEQDVAIGGIPAKKISDFDVERVVIFAREAIENNIPRDFSLNAKAMNSKIRHSNKQAE